MKLLFCVIAFSAVAATSFIDEDRKIAKGFNMHFPAAIVIFNFFKSDERLMKRFFSAACTFSYSGERIKRKRSLSRIKRRHCGLHFGQFKDFVRRFN